jgi:kinesin family protein C1
VCDAIVEIYLNIRDLVANTFQFLQRTGLTRTPSFSSSVSSRTNSRNTSNSSFSSSVGPGGRPGSSYGSRPQTAMSFNKSTTTRPVSISNSRPATSMELHSEEDDMPAQGRRKGMLPLTSIPSFIQSSHGHSILSHKKLRAPQSMSSLHSSWSNRNMRDFSVSTAMSMLQIEENPRDDDESQEHQAISRSSHPPSTPLQHKPSISTGLRNLRIDSTENAMVLFQAPGDSLVAPKTPSHIPVLSKSEAVIATPATPSRTPKLSPQKPQFLSKGSNITSFTAWDVRGRLEDMEALFLEMKDKFSGTETERNGLEEVVALYKARSRNLVPFY